MFCFFCFVGIVENVGCVCWIFGWSDMDELYECWICIKLVGSDIEVWSYLFRIDYSIGNFDLWIDGLSRLD